MPLTAAEWALIMPLVFIPAIANEVQKYVMNRTDRRKLEAVTAA